MIIDESRVNILEKDIEQWLFEHPEEVEYDNERVERWTLRQFRVPSGIADLIGVGTMGETVVVEVKNVGLTSDALTQVCRYAADIESVLPDDAPPVVKIVISPTRVTERLLYEADALGVYVLTFAVTLDLAVSYPWNWGEDGKDDLRKLRESMLDLPDMKSHLQAADEQREEFLRPATDALTGEAEVEND